MKTGEIKKLEAEIKRLQKLVYYDELTGVLNRRGFKEEAEKIFEVLPFKKVSDEKRLPHLPFSIIFIDLDDFKKINDTFGHDAGDLALKRVAATLRHTLRRSDIYGRWGGEEFIVALPDIQKDIAEKIAEKIRGEIEAAKIKSDGENISVTASLGVVSYRDEKTLHEMVEKADKAMYKAKQSGKNRVIVFPNH